MLTIIIPGAELFDDSTNRFIDTEPSIIHLEHSLFSVSKWESKHQIPFLGTTKKTTQQVLDYVFMMILTPNISEEILVRMTADNLETIHKYIESKETATTFRADTNQRSNNEPITSELIYYWMTIFHIPFEAEHWHLNRLFALIRICGIKQGKPKKMSKAAMAQQRRALNEQRKAQYGTSG